eukprot:m.54238 g.54238  ORF g.54238 m.54238 type:complete len:306 (-) comp9186_c0_seq2:158-1075(-)
MFNALLEAARIIEDRPAPVQHVPEVAEAAEWESRRVAPPLPQYDSGDDSVVPRTESPELARSYTRCPETHNEVEKRRRAYLTQCYVELQAVVPSIADCKASNVTVLRNAADYIHNLIEDGSRLEEAKNYELRRRAMLLSRFAAARAAVQPRSAYPPRYYAPTPYAPGPAVAVGHPHPYGDPHPYADYGGYHPSPPVMSPVGRPPMHSAEPVLERVPGDETETDEEEEGVVPDSTSRGASPRAAPGLTELSNQMAFASRKKIRMGVLGDVGNGGPRSYAGKLHRPTTSYLPPQQRRLGRPTFGDAY